MEQEAAVRLRKPASGAVAGGVGPAGTIPGKTRGARSASVGRDVGSFLPMRCRGKKPQERCSMVERPRAEVSGHTV
jgi:hypothetical protein